MHSDRKERALALIEAYRKGERCGNAQDSVVAHWAASTLEARAKQSRKDAKLLREFARLERAKQ